MHVTANVTEHSCVFRSVPSRWREWQANDWTHLQAPQLPGRKYVLWDNQLLQLASSSLSSFLRYSKAGRRLPGPTARQEAAQTDRPAGGCPDRQAGRRLPRPTGRQEAAQTDTCHAARCRTAARVAKAYQMVASRSNSHCTRFEGVRVE